MSQIKYSLFQCYASINISPEFFVALYVFKAYSFDANLFYRIGSHIVSKIEKTCIDDRKVGTCATAICFRMKIEETVKNILNRKNRCQNNGVCDFYSKQKFIQNHDKLVE